MSSFELKMQSMKDTVVEIGKEFTRPDDDWRGMLILDREGVARALCPMAWNNEEEKQWVATVLAPSVITMFKPDFVGQVQSAWSIDSSSGISKEEMHRVRPSARVEIVILMGLTLDQVQFWTAKIQRSKTKPPTLSEWELWPAAAEMTGQFIDPIRDALLEVHGSS